MVAGDKRGRETLEEILDASVSYAIEAAPRRRLRPCLDAETF